MSARILAFGDLHLGAGDRLGDQALVLERIVDLAIARDVDAVCFTGDATHHRSAIQEVAVFQDGLARLNDHRIPVLMIPGNHDVSAMGADSTVEVAAAGFEWCEVARTPGLLGYAVDVAIYALPWCPTSAIAALDQTGQADDVARTATETLMDIARGLKAQASMTGPAVLLLHWSLAGSVTPTGALVDEFREVVLPTVELADMGWDLVIASHIHTPGHLAPNVLYTGSAATVDFGEEHTEHGAWIIEVSAETTTTEFVPIVDRAFLTVGYSHEDECPVITDDGTNRFLGSIVRVRYDATPEQERRVSHESIKAALLAAGVHHVHSVQPNVISEGSTRTAVTEDVDVDQALALWLEHQDTPFDPGVIGVHQSIKEAVR